MNEPYRLGHAHKLVAVCVEKAGVDRLCLMHIDRHAWVWIDPDVILAEDRGPWADRPVARRQFIDPSSEVKNSGRDRNTSDFTSALQHDVTVAMEKPAVRLSMSLSA